MKPIVLTERIAAPRNVVFALATDMSRAVDVYSGIEAIEPLDDEPMGIGYRWRETREIMGRQATEELEITHYDPEGSYTAESDSCGCRYTATLRCDPVGDETLTTLEVTSRPNTFLAKLMAPLGAIMAGPMKKALAQDLADLKRAAESGVA